MALMMLVAWLMIVGLFEFPIVSGSRLCRACGTVLAEDGLEQRCSGCGADLRSQIAAPEWRPWRPGFRSAVRRAALVLAPLTIVLIALDVFIL